jgi:NAD(P)-dependent dehydrogenase (short-subunit alcohol dehydrogenase family)
MKLLENKWALITGSSRGIGQQIALGLAERKCDIIVHARKAENADKTIGLLKPYGVKTHVVTGVLDSVEGVDGIIRAVEALSVKLDILYNNAAIMSKWQPMWQIPQAEWLRVFQTNLFAMVQLCTAFAPGMKERGFGRIINLTSGIKDNPELTPYSVSKAAVDKYSRDLAYELRGSNVLVNFLDPGWLKTDMGGANAEHDVETVLPGALVPALLEDNGPTGQFYAAQDYSMLQK